MFIHLVEGGCLALRLGRYLLGGGARFVEVGLRGLLRGRHGLERIIDRGWRIGLLDRNTLDADAGTVTVQYLLHPLFDLLFDRGTARAQCVVQADAGQHGAHRAFGDFAHGGIGVGQLEQVQFGIADVPAHRIGKVDDILVAGQHQILILRRGRSHVDGADFLDIDDRHRREGGGEGQADTGGQGAAVTAKISDDAAFLRADTVEAGQYEPQDDQDRDPDRP
ncbi:hypothetical protein IL54_4906 [Sphingobium sp. ba1]|nr:hypothetical protein IL54_4906 [Sphingobium sp. ba1]